MSLYATPFTCHTTLVITTRATRRLRRPGSLYINLVSIFSCPVCKLGIVLLPVRVLVYQICLQFPNSGRLCQAHNARDSCLTPCIELTRLSIAGHVSRPHAEPVEVIWALRLERGGADIQCRWIQ